MAETDSSFYIGSLDITSILDALKAGHSAFTKVETKNRGTRVYMNARMWVNKEPQPASGNHASVLINPAEKAVEPEKSTKIYCGNFKYKERGGGAPVETGEATALAAEASKLVDDLPF